MYMKLKNLNKYQSIYATLNNVLGIVYLDSSSNENIYFKSYESLKQEEEVKAKEDLEEKEN